MRQVFVVIGLIVAVIGGLIHLLSHMRLIGDIVGLIGVILLIYGLIAKNPKEKS